MCSNSVIGSTEALTARFVIDLDVMVACKMHSFGAFLQFSALICDDSDIIIYTIMVISCMISYVSLYNCSRFIVFMLRVHDVSPVYFDQLGGINRCVIVIALCITVVMH